MTVSVNLDHSSESVIQLGVVIPVYNEAACLRTLHERLTTVLRSLNLEWQIVYVNDGSTDDSGRILTELGFGDERVSVIELSRNFGKEASMTAGLDMVSAEAVVIMDADLQHPPEVIAEFVTLWRAGADVVVGKRRDRAYDQLWKRIGARFFYTLLSGHANIDIPRDVGDFRLMSKPAVLSLRRLRESHRFMKGLFAWIGFDSHVVEYDCLERESGQSKWGLPKMFNLALEGLTSFSIRPLRIASVIGALTASLSLVYGLWITLRTMFFGDPVPGYPSLMVMILFLGGLQLLALGIIGEYVGRTFDESKDRPVYVVRGVINPQHLLDVEPIAPPARRNNR